MHLSPKQISGPKRVKRSKLATAKILVINTVKVNGYTKLEEEAVLQLSFSLFYLLLHRSVLTRGQLLREKYAPV